MGKRQSSRRPGYLAMVAGLILMALGVMRGEVQAVLEKAVRVCLQCIGIG
ncbi:MAG: CD1871A family CXXC motif-containing protein [Chloroflexota bacterium]